MKKFILYIIILIALVGLFGPITKVEAQPVKGTCTRQGVITTSTVPANVGKTRTISDVDVLKTGCVVGTVTTTNMVNPVQTEQVTIISFNPTGTQAPLPGEEPAPTDQSQFVKNLETCSFVPPNLDGCVKNIFYIIFYQLPAYLLYVCAYFFNVLISVSLNSTLFTHPFVSSAWAIVRDLSNIFFILILIYIAIKIILGLGGHDIKNMIARVVIVALLINFSMFFTGIIIDASNILASIFYNKLNVNTRVNGQITPYDDAAGEKNVAGGMVSAFDPTSKLTPEFFEEAKKVWVDGVRRPSAEQTEVPVSTMIGLILIAGTVMGFAAYALFVSGLSFVGRLIELWILIIFSPFAFMSSSVPFLSNIENLGWKSWFSRLLKVSFMAPVFMFFLYFIFLLIHSKIYESIITRKPIGTEDAAATIKTLLGILLPTCLILFLLLQATKFAKKGSGMVGEALMKAGQTVGGMATGLAIGAATGGTAMALRGTLGRGAANLAESNWVKDRAAQGKFGGTTLLKTGSYLGNKSFDARNAPGAAALAKTTGVNLGVAKTVGLGPRKGFADNRAAAVKKKEDFANKLLDTSDYGKAELVRTYTEKAREDPAFFEDIAIEAAKKGVSENQIILNRAKAEAVNLSSERRTNYANRLQKRRTFISNQMAANKIRADVKQLKDKGSIEHALHEIAHHITPQAGGGHEEEAHAPVAHAPTPASPASPQPAGGDHGGGGHGH